MSYARARQHHRVAERQVKQMAELSDGYFITRNKRDKLIAGAVVLLIVAFIKGIIIGYLFTRED